ncbi:MAG TPA: PspA/IM30 family protein [Candidatus Angelobacter sp.]|jgi:phage shock protein A|nr:PspA/IM30 family protein [Candidatus Angelobacter sp.]
MALLERVSTLIRANLNDLIDKAENPEKLIKQVILDMENQLLQVKTQVAIAIADQHLLAKKQNENEERITEWNRKAEMAVGKNQDDLARAAIERSLQYQQRKESFVQQVADQKLQVETLKNALAKLQQKLEEARAKSELLMAQHRRARTLTKAADAHAKMGDHAAVATFDRMKEKVMRSEAIGQAKTELITESENLDDRFAQLEKEDEVNRILGELKARRQA